LLSFGKKKKIGSDSLGKRRSIPPGRKGRKERRIGAEVYD
jgi:hypothetical protein